MSGSLDDNPPKLFKELTVAAHEYQYLVLARAADIGMASIWFSRQATMTRHEIADQLERLARFVRSTA